MTTEAINLEGVSAKQITLLDDKVLVRVLPREEIRKSGLLLLHGSPEHQVGAEFYGEVVAVGPGALVREGPTADEVAEIVAESIRERGRSVAFGTQGPSELAEDVANDVREFMERRRPMRRIPTDWKPGDQVLVKQGFGVELDLREGRHHVIERAGKFGHGVLASWDPDHVHCWHRTDSRCYAHGHMGDDSSVVCSTSQGHELIERCGYWATCRCGARSRDVETRLPACTECPPGERLAEAVLGGKHVYETKIPTVAPTPTFDPERPRGFSAGELRPE